MSCWCTNGHCHQYKGGNNCTRCGAQRKLPFIPYLNNRHDYQTEVVGEWVHIHMLVQAWGFDLPEKHELLRCARNGTIHVWKDGEWYDDQFTALTDRQQQKILSRCWARDHVFNSISEVPRLRFGTRFTIQGTPEQNGLWRVVTYRQGFVVAHRILPDYRAYRSDYNIRNIAWPQDSSSSAPMESSTTPPSPTEMRILNGLV